MIGLVVLGTCAFLGSCLCACCKTETAGGCCKMGAMTLCVFITVVISKFLDYFAQTGSKYYRRVLHKIWYLKLQPHKWQLWPDQVNLSGYNDIYWCYDYYGWNSRPSILRFFDLGVTCWIKVIKTYRGNIGVETVQIFVSKRKILFSGSGCVNIELCYTRVWMAICFWRSKTFICLINQLPIYNQKHLTKK